MRKFLALCVPALVMLSALGPAVANPTNTHVPGLSNDAVPLPPGEISLSETRPKGQMHAQSSGESPRLYDIYVVDFDLPGSTSPVTELSARRLINEVDDIFIKSLRGKVRLRFMRYQSGGTIKPTCELNDVAQSAKSVTGDLNASPDAAGYLRISVTPDQPCAFAGIAYLGGVESLINGFFTSGDPASKQVVAHEIGHNLGLHHANTLTCNPKDGFAEPGSACIFSEYRDRSDVMGNDPNSNAFSFARQRFLSVIDADVSAVILPEQQSYSRTIDLVPLYAPANVTGTRGAVVYAKGKLDATIEYRPGVGMDSALTSWDLGQGVQLRLWGVLDGDARQSWLYTGKDRSTDGKPSPWSLSAGDAVHLPGGALVTVNSVTPEMARVTIATNETDTAPPVLQVYADWIPPGAVEETTAWNRYGLGTHYTAVDTKVDEVTMSIDGQVVHTFHAPQSDGLGRDDNWTQTVGSALDRYSIHESHTIEVRATDSAGNSATATHVIRPEDNIFGLDRMNFAANKVSQRPPRVVVRGSSAVVEVYRTSRLDLQYMVPTECNSAWESLRKKWESGVPVPLGQALTAQVDCELVHARAERAWRGSFAASTRSQGLAARASIAGIGGATLWRARKGSWATWSAGRAGRMYFVARGRWTLTAGRSGKPRCTREQGWQLCRLKAAAGTKLTAKSRGNGLISDPWVE